ncbi:MAG: CPBP family intramembrane metalloprotease [Acholeplasmataceae bacterium]|nr:CPBP family intramembrane metalloprotease [Acholeplasmataceae bacterium]
MNEQNKNTNLNNNTNNKSVLGENEKKEYTFDDLFENKTASVEAPSVGEYSTGRSWLIIGLYFIIFVFFATLVQIVLITIPGMTEEYNSTEGIVRYLEKNKGVSYASINDYDLLEDKGNIQVLDRGGYYYLLFSNDIFSEDQVFDEAFIREIFKEGKFVLDEIEIERIENGGDKEKIKEWLVFDGEDFEPTFDLKIDDFFGFTKEAGIISNFIVYVAGIIVLVVLSVQVLKTDFKVLNKKFLPILSMLGMGYLFMIGGNIVSGFLSEILSNLLDYQADTSVNQEMINQMLTSNLAPLMIFTILVGAPIVEELVFRKAFFSLIKNQWVALVVSSLVFSLIHIVGETTFAGFIINLIVYGASGAALGFVYIYYKRNIYAPIFVHALSNLISVLVFYLFPNLV